MHFIHNIKLSKLCNTIYILTLKLINDTSRII